MTTHCFVVDSQTLDIHLKYMFAGTGAKDFRPDFNAHTSTKHHQTVERMLVGMIADGCRIRKDDNIIFYLQQNSTGEGKFFGIFKAAHDCIFIDDEYPKNYLQDELGKLLTFRVLIYPKEVYSVGVTEWEALDTISKITAPNQMIWQLIYRKLRGKRGNTMVTIYEAERLLQLIREKNRHIAIDLPNHFIFNGDVIEANEKQYHYMGECKKSANILPRFVAKHNRGEVAEVFLQAYILSTIGKNDKSGLDNILPNNTTIEWIGNEVGCGVGMQKIDIMIACISNTQQKFLLPIELKATCATKDNTRQLQRYIDWISQYYLPNTPSTVLPILIVRKNKKNILQKENWILLNQSNSHLLNLRVFEYDIETTVSFNEVVY